MEFDSDYSTLGDEHGTITDILERVYDFVDNSSYSSNLFVFSLDSQLDEIKHFFKWVRNYSDENDMKLSKPIICLDLESLYTHINQSLGRVTAEEELSLFRDDTFSYFDLCEFHKKKASTYLCAISLARGYAFLLAKRFAQDFGVELKEGRHFPLNYLAYQPLDLPDINVLNLFSTLE